MNRLMSYSDCDPDEAKELVRASCVRRGSLPSLKRGTVVYLYYSGQWLRARLTRTIPGGCYCAVILTYPACGTFATVTVGSFGGVEGDA
jgi:hypothetical protein